MANTTIQISKDLLNELKAKKRYSNESYEDVLWDLLEDTMELSEETLKDIEIARKEYKEGKTHTLAEVKKELGL
ncbi:MAG: hypothetical protein ABIB43_04875 [archaeon]